MSTPIFLTDPSAGDGGKITQLYAGLELYSEGEPARNTLFVLGTPALSVVSAEPEQLLIIDPPADLVARFALEGNVAVLFSSEPRDVGVPQLQTQAGGIAHVRIGDHFVDVYSQNRHTVALLPALGLLWGGPFGSDCLPPRLAPASDGSDELDTLRLLAGLLKRTVQLFIPETGTQSDDRVTTMARLADDVAYLHTLRRIVPPAVRRGENQSQINVAAESALAGAWHTDRARSVHEENVRVMIEAVRRIEGSASSTA